MKSTLISTLAAGVTALAVVAGAAADDVDKLIADAASQDKDVRVKAIRTLGSLGPDAAAAVPVLSKALEDEAPDIRAYAAYALGAIGDKSPAVVDKLIDKALDPDPVVRRQAVRALIRLDPPQEKTLPTVLKILREGDRDIIGPAMQTVVEEGEKVVPRLCEALDNEEASYWACVVLADIGPKAKAAVPHIKDVLKNDQEEVRMQALITLGEIGPASGDLVPEIVALLKNDPAKGVRYAAAFALGKIGTGPEATAALKESLQSEDDFLELTSAWALARNNPDDAEMLKRTVDLIVKAFKSDDVNLRRAAAKAAVEFEVPLDVVAPLLLKALQDEDPRLVQNAIETLVDLGPKALKHMDELLKHPELRFYALPLVLRLGPEAAPAVPALVAALKSKPRTEADEVFRREAQFALAKIGPAATDAVPTLVESLDSEREDIVASACFALGKIGPDASAAVPALRRKLGSPRPIVQFASIRALLRILPGERRLVPVARVRLLKGLESDIEFVRAECAATLGEIGSAAKSALPRLKKLLDDESEMVRAAAAKAIKQIEQ